MSWWAWLETAGHLEFNRLQPDSAGSPPAARGRFGTGWSQARRSPAKISTSSGVRITVPQGVFKIGCGQYESGFTQQVSLHCGGQVAVR